MNIFEVTYMFLGGADRLEATETVETEYALEDYSTDLADTLKKHPLIVVEVGPEQNLVLRSESIYAASVTSVVPSVEHEEKHIKG